MEAWGEWRKKAKTGRCERPEAVNVGDGAGIFVIAA
jgi:hypothetical protein